ncbi:MAG: ABC transporter substrate-binding protein [Burkholderiaceae bacterium]|jgi:iron complex transport system substrate-binding protein|nr:ABC transporter substrate-binding protein [Burkholderiaceae bacterium]
MRPVDFLARRRRQLAFAALGSASLAAVDLLARSARAQATALSRPALLHGAAPRVVSVGGALTEIVYALGAESLLVGSDTTSVYPPAARQMPKVGYARSLSAEGVLSLRPTVLLATAEAGPPAAIAQLASAGVRVLRAQAGHGFDALAANVQQVGDALQRAAEAQRLNAKLRDQWRDLRAALRVPAAPPRVLFVLSHVATNVQVSGDGTSAATMIALAGAANALSGFSGYRPLTAEAAVKAAPDLILTTAQGAEAVGGIDRLLAQPGLPLTPAGRARRVLALDALYLLGGGPRLPQAVAEVARFAGTLG